MTTIQFDLLADVCKATETLPLGGFRMDDVCCGTAGCMIGNYNAMVGRHPQRFHFKDAYSTPIDDWDVFGITKQEYNWLFSGWCSYGLRTQWDRISKYMEGITQNQALTRLRKFIAYKRRKHAMIHDPKYGVRDEARHAEGNQLFAVLAVQDALVEMSLATTN